MVVEMISTTIIYLLCLNVAPIWTMPSCPHPASVPNAHVHLQPSNTEPDKYGRYPAGTQATVDCYNGFHLKYNELKYLLCNEAGEWISSIKFPIDGICQRDGCGPPPFLDHGRYTNERNRLKSAGRSAPPESSSPVGVILKPTCDASFSLNCSSNQCGRIICEGDGNWAVKKGDFNAGCFPVADPQPIRSQNSDYDEDATDSCGPPPKIEHGYYTIEQNRFKQTSPASPGADSYPVRTVLHPACEKSFSLNCSRQCGRITCEPNKRWAPKDDKFIRTCVAEPLLVRSNLNRDNEAFCTNPPKIAHAGHDAPPDQMLFDPGTTLRYECFTGYIVRGFAVSKCFVYNTTSKWFGPDIICEESHGTGSEASTKHYLVLAVAIVSIVGVCILTVILLRRPTFCKKSRGTSGSGGRDGGRGGGSDVPVIITSSSPASHLDSLPVAMNTGIFLPGQSYDMQDCHFQDAPICGTSVFK